jgi:LysM repeat protein
MKKVVLGLALVLLVMALFVPAVSAAPPEAPSASGGYWYHVQYGNTLYGISRYTGVSVQAIVNANGLTNPNCIYAGQNLWIPAYTAPPQNPCNVGCGARYHTVQWGQTLTGIGAMYGVSPWAIANANGLYNLNCIYAGQVLYIPYY